VISKCSQETLRRLELAPSLLRPRPSLCVLAQRSQAWSIDSFFIYLPSCFSRQQWPEDFDFKATRALNAPTTTEAVRSSSPDVELNSDLKSQNEKQVGVDVQSLNESQSGVMVADPDLDPVGLDKAFHFASWCSIILVGLTSHSPGQLEALSLATRCRP